MMNQKTEKKTTDTVLTRSIYEFTKVKNVDIDDNKEIINSNEFIKNKPDADSDPFLYSLETLTPDDITTVKKKKRRTLYDIIFEFIRFVLLAVCAGVFVYSAYQIGFQLWSYIVSDRMTKQFAGSMDFIDDTVFNGEYTFSGDLQLSPKLTQSITSPNFETSLVNISESYDITTDTLTVSVYNKNLEFKKSQMNNFVTEYPDTYAWIKVPQTRIDFIVMQTTDNDFYLNHTPSGSYLTAGSIFADYRCNTDLMKNFNTILYGHNMGNGTMFNDVVKYLKEDFFNENPNIEIYTNDGIYKYEIFSIHEAREDDDYIRTSFPTVSEFVKFAESLQERSLYRRDGVKFTEDSTLHNHILTLSTCTNRERAGRYALHARLVGYER